MSAEPQIRYLREPSYKVYRALESDLFEHDEYYLYQVNGAEVIRRKIGGWVNLYSLFPLIDEKDENLRQRVDEFPVLYTRPKKDKPKKYDGVYAPLETARAFAEEYGIYNLVAPILAFNRVALVTYMGSLFYEYFATSRHDSHIRILRECNEHASERLNMDQIFVAYRKHKGKDAIRELERSFHTYYPHILKKGDPTLCGGSWVAKNAVLRFINQHGIWHLLSPIVDFQGNDPSTGKEYAIDVIQRDLAIYWRVTTSDDGFYGYPFTFKGGKAANKPRDLSKGFAFSKLCSEKRLVIENTKQDKTNRKHLSLLRRLSDGFVNASYLVSICVLLKLNELNLGEEDPDLLIANELYQRDQLERLPCEIVATSKSKYANGYWCSITVARNLFASFHIKKDNEQGRKVHDFLYSHSFDDIEKDTDGNLLKDTGHNGQDSGDEFAPIAENDFRELQNNERETIYYDHTFFDDNAPALVVDRIEFADFNEDVDGNKDESQEDIEDGESEDASRQNDDHEDNDAPNSRKRTRSNRKNLVFDSSDEEDEHDEGVTKKMAKVSNMFVDPDDEEPENPEEREEPVDQRNSDSDINSLFGSSQPSTEDKQSHTSSQASENQERLEKIQRQRRVDETTAALKSLSFKLNECLSKNQSSKKVGLQLKGLFTDLSKYRAIDDPMMVNSGINQTLKRTKAVANSYTRQAESIIKTWKSQVEEGEFPGKPGDPVKKSEYNNYGQLRSNKVPPPPPNPPYSRRTYQGEQQGPPVQNRGYQSPHGPPRQPGPPHQRFNRPPSEPQQPNGYYNNYYQQSGAPPQPNPYQRNGQPLQGNTGYRPYNPSQNMPSQSRFGNQPIPPGPQLPRPQPQPQPQPQAQPQTNQPNFGGRPRMANQSPQLPQIPQVSPSLVRPQPNQPIYFEPSGKPASSPHYIPISQPQPQPQPQPLHHPTPMAQPRGNNSGGSSPNLSFLPLKKFGPQPQSSYTPNSDHYQTSSAHQTKYRERPVGSAQSQAYIPGAPPPTGPVRGPGPSYGYARNKKSTSASPKNKQKEASNTILKEIQRPLSPPSNYLNLPNEPLDIIDIALQEYQNMVNEAKIKSEEEIKSREDELNELKKMTHFETRTKQDLFKRAKVFYENEKKKIGFTKKLHALMNEAYTRRQRHKAAESKA